MYSLFKCVNKFTYEMDIIKHKQNIFALLNHVDNVLDPWLCNGNKLINEKAIF